MVQSVARPFSTFEELHQKAQGVRAIPSASGVSKRLALAEGWQKNMPLQSLKNYLSRTLVKPSTMSGNDVDRN